ncbi:TIGR04283 family arsenosugar biosynthesis glycosyltransferase [Alcanivorax sp. 1008]|uniref:TIGR04283 family arsenosugar biosynthesis glycosyltransferase n=1 Tax=Alcanivorax sp. 1008 TaxID=2816853 RepID=UPI001D2C167A|nr:TIGR04283 family arsenosugar biosynthesis glycosyltransferase [Alcanivorax sp. 1008]
MDSAECWLSIIIPTLDEAQGVVGLLQSMQPWRAQGAELILVDGGSRDNTVALATPLTDQMLTSSPGRALQMNAGAASARGRVLWFVHADSYLAGDEIHTLKSCLPELVSGGWGRFDVMLSGADWRLRLVATMMNLRSRITAIATGDQGIFISRCWFDRVAGFPVQPLMEDVEISARLRRLGRPVCLRQRITTDSRRWQRHGVWRTVSFMWWLRWRYFRGASAEELHRYYYAAEPSDG